jgi:ATP-dependent Clp protease ATP-binding subunit ClpA
MAAQVLESLEISQEAARWLVEETIGRVEQTPSGPPQFTPRAKKVLDMASRLSPGYDYVGTWHILLGLLQEGDGVGAVVLTALGADQYRVGLRVTQLLNGDRGNEAPGEGSQPSEQAYARLLDNPLARIDALDRRLAAIEHRLGVQPDLGHLDQQSTVRRETAAAVGMREFETATGLRGHETQRPAPRSPRQGRLERAAAGQLSLARELGRLYAELDELRAILRQHGIDPGDDPA